MSEYIECDFHKRCGGFLETQDEQEAGLCENCLGEAAEREKEIDDLRAEVERLKGCLKKANANHELFEREWYLRGDKLETQAAEIEALREEVQKANDSRFWYQRRVDLLQSMQPNMRDPERTVVCDILANGLLLSDSDPRYTVKSDVESTAQAAEIASLTDELNDTVERYSRSAADDMAIIGQLASILTHIELAAMQIDVERSAIANAAGKVLDELGLRERPIEERASEDVEITAPPTAYTAAKSLANAIKLPAGSFATMSWSDGPPDSIRVWLTKQYWSRRSEIPATYHGFKVVVEEMPLITAHASS